MLKHEYLVCMDLHRLIKDKVTGTVFAVIDNDTLVVHINGPRGINYKHEYKNISCEMIGRDLRDYDKVVNIILDSYKEFVMNKFFRR